MNIQETTFAPKTYLLWRKEIPMADIADKAMWGSAYQKVNDYIRSHDIEVAGPGTALYFTWDQAKGRTEIGIGMPVKGVKKVSDPGLSLVSIPKSKATHATLRGDYEELKSLHDSLMSYVRDKNVKPKVVIEEYTVDPMQKPDSKDWETNVYYLY